MEEQPTTTQQPGQNKIRPVRPLSKEEQVAIQAKVNLAENLKGAGFVERRNDPRNPWAKQNQE